MEPGLRLLAVGLVLGVTLVAFETTAVITALPTITDELGGDSLYGVALAAYTLANMLSIVAAGRLADRKGPLPVFLTSVAVFVIGLVVAAVAPNMVIVVLGRTLQGAGGGGFGPIAYQLVKRAYPDDRQATMYVYLSAGWVLPSLVGPAFGGLVTDHLGWRWVFAGIVPMAIAVGAITSRPMRRYGPTAATDDPAELAADRRKIATAGGAALGVAILVISLPASQWAVIVFGGLFGGWIAVRMLAKLLPAGILRARRGQPAVLACRLLATSTFMGVDGFLPLAADRIHGASPMAQGFTIIGAALTWTGGQALIARRPDVKPQHAVRLGFSILGLGALLVTPVLWSGWPLWATFLGWAVGGLGMGVLYNPTTVAAMSYAVEGSEGDTGGQMQLVDSLGFSLMGGIGGAVVAFADRSSFALRDAIGVCFGLAFACAVLGAFAARGVRAATP
ncbi:MAG: MFS transporter [Actinobacteria bacterium]|nr:MFS transporter [Actinomycetota bacterium]